jgi:hypothetical protein
MPALVLRLAPLLCALWLCACAPHAPSKTSASLDEETPVLTVRTFGGITLGEPIAITRDFEGNLLIADRAPGQVVHFLLDADRAVEFQSPPSGPGFSPADLQPSGFFVYVVDPVERTLLRFYKSGNYLDVLIDFNVAFPGRRVTPAGLDVDGSGRIALADVKNHEILIFNTYLDVELQFGGYGKSPGQLDSPEGVAFTPQDGILAVDTGNRRVQLFDSNGAFARVIPGETEPNPLQKPRRAIMDSAGQVYVADPEAGGVFVFDGGVLSRTITPGGSKPFRPSDVTVAPSGMVYVTDQATGSLLMFR